LEVYLDSIISTEPEKLKAFDRSLSLNPNNVNTITNKAWVLSKLQRFLEAILWYDKALAIDQDNKKALKGKNYCVKKIRDTNYKNQQKFYSTRNPSPLSRSPTPENQGIFDKIKDIFK
jgi:tetratricopeptide (TPR) repeat protein